MSRRKKGETPPKARLPTASPRGERPLARMTKREFYCARLILDAEIKKIVFVEAYPTPETSKFLKQAIEVKPFTGFTARAFFRVFPKVS